MTTITLKTLKKFLLPFGLNLVNEELMKSIVILLQNDKGDREILLRILNDLKNDKKPFGPDKSYLKTVLEKHMPQDKYLLTDMK